MPPGPGQLRDASMPAHGWGSRRAQSAANLGASITPPLVSKEAFFKGSGNPSSPLAETWQSQASPAPWHCSCMRGCSHPFPLMWILWCVLSVGSLLYPQCPAPHEEEEGARRVHRGTSRYSHNKPRPLSQEGSAVAAKLPFIKPRC